MKTRTRNLKRLLSWLLCLSMVAGLLPATVLAADAPAITTEALETATVGVTYSAELTATASDPNGELTWEVTGLPNGLALTESGNTATLIGTPTEAGDFSVTVTVTETIPAEPEDPAEGTEPTEETELTERTAPAEGTEPTEGAEPAQPTMLTVSREYTLTVAEAVQPEPEPVTDPLLTTGGGARTAYQSVSATIYTSQNEYGGFENPVSTFPVDQAGLILDLRSFNQAVSSGWSVESIAFYPVDGSSQWGTVFWFNGTEGYPCNNGEANDKLYVDGAYNGVFQILNFTPNGNQPLDPGTYKVLVYVGNGLDYPNYEETLYLSTETFTITAAAGPGVPVINTSTLPSAYLDVAYNATLSATAAAGGSLSWQVTSGSLPDGLTLSGNGVISGTPTTAQSSSFTVTVSEELESGEVLTASKAFTLDVTEKLEITTQTNTFQLTRGTAFSLKLEATAADASWSIASGRLPSNLYMSSNGVISGSVSTGGNTGEYKVTVKASAGGQTATKELTFILGELFKFNLPDDIDSDVYGNTVYLVAKADDGSDKDIYLWSGRLDEGRTTLAIFPSFTGQTVSNTRLVISVKGSGSDNRVVLASVDGSLTLAEGSTADLVSAGDILTPLPEIVYEENCGDYVYTGFWVKGYRFASGNLVEQGSECKIDISTLLYSRYSFDGNDTYNLSGDPTFEGEGVTVNENGEYVYTASGSGGGTITVKFPEIKTMSVTFKLEALQNAEEHDFAGSTLSIQQNINGKSIVTSATIEEGNVCSAELYRGAASVTLLNSVSSFGLVYDDTNIANLTENVTLHYWSSAYTATSLMVTVTGLEDALASSYISNLGGYLSLTMEVGGESWGIGSVNLGSSAAQRINLWMSKYSAEIASLIDNGEEFTLSWSARGIVEGKKTFTWTKGNFSSSAEVEIDFQSGVLVTFDPNAITRTTRMQDWWYYVESEKGVWVKGASEIVYPGSESISFCCPLDEEIGTCNFLLVPELVQISAMSWDEASESFSEMPQLEDMNIAQNSVATVTSRLDDTEVASARYLTLPNSTLSGPAQFSTKNDVLTFTGTIRLDDGVEGKTDSLVINAAGVDGKVAFQIASLKINGVTYNYAGIHLSSDKTSYDTLLSEQFTTEYILNFSEPITLPCSFTIYGSPMTEKSDVTLDISANLTDTSQTLSRLDSLQPVGSITTKAPSISVSIPSVVGTDVATAYVTTPGNSGFVDIYDGETLVVSRARAGETKIPLVGTSSSRTTSHRLTFRLSDYLGNLQETYEVTVLHVNGAPTLVEQILQTKSFDSNSPWYNHARDTIYSFTSDCPPHFRAVCTIENSENISGDVSFLFYLLDGSVELLPTDWRYDSTADIDDMSKVKGNGDVYVSKPLRSNSPVISVLVLYEIDWELVNRNLQNYTPQLPADSPSENLSVPVTFTETVVIPYEEHNVTFSELPTTFPETPTPGSPSKEELLEQINALQQQIVNSYEESGGQAGYYIIDIGSGQFMPALEMIDGLDTGYIPQGETGTTTMTRPLTTEQLQGELGSGEWSRYTFTEPGETGGATGGETGGVTGGETTGIEIYTQGVSTEGGVDATITIATNGETTVEFVTAQAEGTGTNLGSDFTLPASGSYSSGECGSGYFSFTNFESDGMSVFSNICGDVTFGSTTIKDITSAVSGAEASGFFAPLERGLGAYSFAKDMMDGMSNQLTLTDLLNAPNTWLTSSCAQKLPANFRTNMQNQINQLVKDVRDAEGWNMVTTGANYVLGAGGLLGAISNPIVGIIGGVAAWGAGKITSQKISNVQQQATVLKDTIDMQITKTALASGDMDCLKKKGKDDSYRVCIDPSGIVYEAVLSNPVEGATVTLYTDGIDYTPEYTDNVIADQYGNLLPPSNIAAAYGATLTTPDVNSIIPPDTILTTEADGRFQWMVEQGLWYVTADKDGYEPGDSGNDIAAVVTDSNGRSWLPVAPEQLNVNIPLVSYAAPTVKAEAREDGVYLTFSKYMDESTLVENNFSVYIVGQDTAIVPVSVEKLNSEQAPGNIDYGTGNSVPSYTSQVKLAVADGTTLSGDVTVTISPNVLSYAGVPCAVRAVDGTVGTGALVEAPTVKDGPTGGTVAYGSSVTLNIPDGAAVYYTTDGSDPSFDNSGQPTGSTVRYYKDQQIIITKTMTLKAVAVKYGVRSEMVPATFTVSGTGGDIPGGDDTPGSDDTPVTPVNPGGSSGSYDDSGYSVSVPASSSIRGGSITVSPRSADKGDTVTITVKPDEGYELDTLTVTDSKGKEIKLIDKGNNKYTFTMPGSSVKIQVSFKETELMTNPFADVYESDYYYDAVLWAVANGVTAGTSATTFSPNAPVTRAQMVTFLWRAYGSPKATGSNPFADVSADAWYYDAVLWAVANGVTVGTSATTFSPDAPVTRSQAVTFQWRAAGSPVVAGDSFDDVAADAYYAGAVTWAVANGITNGTGGNKFSPEVTVTRAQAVTFLWRELA